VSHSQISCHLLAPAGNQKPWSVFPIWKWLSDCVKTSTVYDSGIMPRSKFMQVATVIGKTLCRLILPLNQSSAKRWFEIFAYAAIAIPTVGLLFAISYNELLNFDNNYFPFGDHWLVFAVGVLLTIWLHWIVGFRPKQVLLYIKYPGVPVAVFLALLINSVGAHWSTKVAGNNREVLWSITIAYGAILFLIGICAEACDISKNISSVKWRTLMDPKTPLSELSADRLISWAQDSKEIDDYTEDYFDFAPRAKRVLNTLRKKERQCVAVVGPYGSGKSSLIRFVEKESNRSQNTEESLLAPLLWFCCVSCWGFEKGDSAPEAILRQVVEQLHRRVDCLAIRGLPTRNQL
jgi:KAP family P-loop domain